MKVCFKCKNELDISQFYAHSKMGDGYLGKCKECTKRDSTANRIDKIDYYREYDKMRGNRITQEKQKEYRSRNVQAYKARAKTINSFRYKNKKLVKKPCEICGSIQVYAHHDDYSKPFEVRWLCPSHHSIWHKRHGTALNAS